MCYLCYCRFLRKARLTGSTPHIFWSFSCYWQFIDGFRLFWPIKVLDVLEVKLTWQMSDFPPARVAISVTPSTLLEFRLVKSNRAHWKVVIKISNMNQNLCREALFGVKNKTFTAYSYFHFICYAKKLRRKFVFKLVPMLNPDGVIVGNYRTNLAARDLNRTYKDPKKVI